MRSHSNHGFTLIELLIAVAVTLVVIGGAVVVVRAQQKAYYDGQRLRGAQGAARRALLSLERNLPSAGFGMDAALAFDIGGTWVTGPCPSPMGSCPRDSTGNSDELVFFARDPRYWIPATNTDDPVGNAWRIQSVGSGSVSLFPHPNLKQVFPKGQIFLAVCSSSSSYAYFTSSQKATFDETGVSSPSAGTIQLAPVATANPFRRQDVAAALGCFTYAVGQAPARLFLVNQYRYHVRPVAVSGTGTSTQYDPILVLDRGVDTNGDNVIDENDEELVAEGVESLQVAYSFYSAAIPYAGATPGAAITATAGAAATAGTTTDAITTTLFPGAAPQPGQTAYAPSSFYPYTFGPPPDPTRNTNHQANVQAVRVSLLVRSTGSDVQGNTSGATYLPVLNQNAQPAWVSGYAASLGGRDGYQRLVLDTTVTLPNMATRAMTYF